MLVIQISKFFIKYSKNFLNFFINFLEKPHFEANIPRIRDFGILPSGFFDNWDLKKPDPKAIFGLELNDQKLKF